MPISAENATERAEQLVILTERLTALMDQEVKFLDEQRPECIQQLTEERTTLSTIYSQEMGLIKQDNALLAGISRDLKDRLKDVTATFQATLAAHELVLQRLRSISEKIIKSVSDEVAKTRAPKLGYGKNARLTARPSHASVPVALNQTA